MDDPNNGGTPAFSPKAYALSGKIMLSAIVILFTVLLLILCLHVYARWYLRRAQRRRRERRLLIFTAEQGIYPGTSSAANKGLDPVLLKSIPVFTFSTTGSGEDAAECAVCLCDFEENDKGRTLPGCKHSFHIECIDMWFYSHSTCPLCRSTVQSAVPELSGPCDSCRHEDVIAALASPSSSPSPSSSLSPSSSTSTSSSPCPTSPGPSCGIRIEVPMRRAEEEMKSPVGRMLSFRNVLGMDLSFHRSGAAAAGGLDCPSHEPDLERGQAESQRL